MNNKDINEILASIVQLGAFNTTQLEAIIQAVEIILVESGICKRGELQAKVDLEAAKTQDKYERKAANKMKRSRKYPDISKLPSESFGKKQ